MGMFHVELEVAGPARGRYERVEALVDTGFTYTVLPRGLLGNLGVHAEYAVPVRSPTAAGSSGSSEERGFDSR